MWYGFGSRILYRIVVIILKSLVIYFSRSGENYVDGKIKNIDKGNTEIVAEKISEITGASLFKVNPVKDYPFDYKECCKVASFEFNNNKRPLIKEKIDISGYDVIYIGGPIWCGHYPMCLFTALENIDFKGKIVKPFVTHEGSLFANTKEDIEYLCTGAIIKEGLAIVGSKSFSCDEIVEKWCEDVFR